MTDDNTPSDHSFVAKSNSPYNSPNETAFGLIGNSYKFVKFLGSTFKTKIWLGEYWLGVL